MYEIKEMYKTLCGYYILKKTFSFVHLTNVKYIINMKLLNLLGRYNN